MSRVEIIAMVLRVAAIFVFLIGLFTLIELLLMANGLPAMEAIILPAFLVGLSFFTWLFSVDLARRILPEQDPGTTVVTWTVGEIERIGIRLVGLYVGTLGLSRLISAIAFRWQVASELTDTVARARSRADFAGAIAMCLLACCLVLGKDTLKRAWRSVRGQDPEDMEPLEEGPEPPTPSESSNAAPDPD
jgi:hypothetical protein